jgi:hypothetical protein
MSELSSIAQAVLTAYNAGFKHPVAVHHKPRIAAALRAAADQVVPDEPLYGGDQRWMFERDARQACRKKLLAIADALEAQ